MKRTFLCTLLLAALTGCTTVNQEATETITDPKTGVTVKNEVKTSGRTLFDGKTAIANMHAQASKLKAGAQGVQQESTSAMFVEMFALGRDLLSAYLQSRGLPAAPSSTPIATNSPAH